LISIDLKDAYLHVPIAQCHRKFLRFKVGGQPYQYKVVAFGQSTAPQLFTKILAPIVAEARKRGIHVYPYLDDWIVRFQDREQLKWMGQYLVDSLQERGWIINWPKSNLDPKQCLTFIGWEFVTQKGLVRLPMDSVESILECILMIKIQPTVEARLFLRMLGLMASTLEEVPFERLRMRPLQMYLLCFWKPTSMSLEYVVPIKDTLIQHLEWWEKLENLRKGCPLQSPEVSATITTDASNDGWGGWMGNLEVQGQWTLPFKNWHINLLELEAVRRTCEHFQNQLQNKHVLIQCDNSTVVSYINRQGGTKSPSLCMLLWKFLLWAQERGISFQAVHVAGESNVRADRLSRVFASPLEWMLDKRIVRNFFGILGVPQIDLFASQVNHQLPVYCARNWDDQAYHINALNMSWESIWG
jgi:hypothetical protein